MSIEKIKTKCEVFPLIQDVLSKGNIAWLDDNLSMRIGPFEEKDVISENELCSFIHHLNNPKENKELATILVGHDIDYQGLDRYSQLHTTYDMVLSAQRFPGKKLKWLLTFTYYIEEKESEYGIVEVKTIYETFVFIPENQWGVLNDKIWS